MILPLQKFSSLLAGMAASVQGGAAQLIDLSVGSVLRALLEASAAVALWMQWLILQVLTMTRAATSAGPDLDSWMADFGLSRLPGAASTGLVTLSRYTAGLATTVPTGTTIRTYDGSLSVSVVADPMNPAWNGISGYIVASEAKGVTVAAQALLPGAAGNLQIGALGVLTVAIPGIDTALNSAAFGGGVDPETDSALRGRFPLYINSRAAATTGAIEFAVATVQQGLRYAVIENVDTQGSPRQGNFWVVVDDGTGAPSNYLLASVDVAIENVRPIGSTYSVTGPAIVPVTVQMDVITANPLTRTAVLTAIQAAVLGWIGGLPIAGTLAISKIDALAHSVDPSVISVSGTSINGVSIDISAPENGVIIAITVAVS